MDKIFLYSQEVIKVLKSKQNSINLHKEEIELLNLNEKFKEINFISLYLSQKFNEFTDDQKKLAKDRLNINIDNQRKVLNDYIKSNIDITIKYKSIIFPPKSNFDDNNNSISSHSAPTTNISSTDVPTTNTVVSDDNTPSNLNVFPFISDPNINYLNTAPNPVAPNSNCGFNLLTINNYNNLLNNIISNPTTASSASDIPTAIAYFENTVVKGNINENEAGKELGYNNDSINTDNLDAGCDIYNNCNESEAGNNDIDNNAILNEVNNSVPDESKNGNLSKASKLKHAADESITDESITDESNIKVAEKPFAEELVADEASKTKKKKSSGKKKPSITYHFINSSKFSNPDFFEVYYDIDYPSGGIASFIVDIIDIFNSHGVDKIIQETSEYNKKQGRNGSLEPLKEYSVSKDNGKLNIDIKTPKGKSNRFISQSFKLNDKLNDEELIKVIIKIMNRRAHNRNEENSKIMNLKLAENLFKELENNNKYKNILKRFLKSLVKAYNDEKNQKKQIIKVISSYKDLIDEIKRFVGNEKKNLSNEEKLIANIVGYFHIFKNKNYIDIQPINDNSNGIKKKVKTDTDNEKEKKRKVEEKERKIKEKIDNIINKIVNKEGKEEEMLEIIDKFDEFLKTLEEEKKYDIIYKSLKYIEKINDHGNNDFEKALDNIQKIMIEEKREKEYIKRLNQILERGIWDDIVLVKKKIDEDMEDIQSLREFIINFNKGIDIENHIVIFIKKKEEGNTSTDTGNETQEEGNTSTDTGNETQEEGNTSTDTGNETQEEGNTSTDTGNETQEGGNTSTDTGNETQEEGNTSTDTGNETQEEGNTSTDTGNETQDAISNMQDTTNKGDVKRKFINECTTSNGGVNKKMKKDNNEPLKK